ncbi:MAG: DUF2089 domain-containing protein [Oscillospiraceae bacterium]|nr:DUF2089 domain-containing protein [Oscillospiraceae bacterium]
MMYEQPAHCPVCRGNFHVKQLICANCGSMLEGAFEPGRLSRLSGDMQQFVITFLECRGNIREMEKYLNISYPTVRARLDDIIASLGGQSKTTDAIIGGDGSDGSDNGDGGDGDDGSDDSDGGDGSDSGDSDDGGDSDNGGDGGDSNDSGEGSDGGVSIDNPSRLEILMRLSNGEIDTDEAFSLLGGKERPK